MKRIACCFSLLFLAAIPARAQNADIKFIADTLVIQADGIYQADPDLATLTFDISSQDKELKPAYDKASAAVQKIMALAEKNGVAKADVYTGVLRVAPNYNGDRKKTARSFSVTGEVELKVRDFSKLGPIMDESVTDEITDFRSLTYSLENEEAAKQKAVGAAMNNATGRATAALEQKGQKIGALRFANVDVSQLTGAQEVNVAQLSYESRSAVLMGTSVESFPYTSHGHAGEAHAAPPPPPPLPRPEKISLRATIQCAFQIL